MKKIIMLLFITIICLFNSNVYAEGVCDASNINRLKTLAKNVEITYEHNVYGDVGSDDPEALIVSVFDFTVAGLTDELYIVDDNFNKYYYEEVVDGILNFISFSGERKIYIYSKNCYNEILDTRTFNLPVFNFNSMSDECKKEEFRNLDICAEFINKNEVIQGDEFKGVIEQEREKSFLDKILNFVKDNALILLFGFIVLIVIIVFIVFRHYKRSALE